MISKIAFADERVKKAFLELKDSKSAERQLYDNINKVFDALEKNPICGKQIQRRLIPKEFIQKYRIDNLWKYDLPGAWRLLYSLFRDEIFIVSIILKWCSHKEYEKLFKYKAR